MDPQQVTLGTLNPEGDAVSEVKKATRVAQPALRGSICHRSRLQEVLGDAIKYLQHLQERVNTQEEQAAKQTMESVVHVKRSQQILLEDEGSSDESGGIPDEQPLPEIEAKMCDKNVLLRIHCESIKGS
ncbi:hypothetical protein ACH5RR_001526 [Cinchona calisaya]|uniref:BHLH domain-containing protein n=1 Tax=Cinchona calisaya TaxID=153742 RepID=A0ABD3B467_9GENT